MVSAIYFNIRQAETNFLELHMRYHGPDFDGNGHNTEKAAFSTAFLLKKSPQAKQIDDAVIKCLNIICEVKEAHEGAQRMRKELDVFLPTLPPNRHVQLYQKYLQSLKELLRALKLLHQRFRALWELHVEQRSPQICQESIVKQSVDNTFDIEHVEKEISEAGNQIEILKGQPGCNPHKVPWQQPHGEKEKAALRTAMKERLWRQPLEYDPPIVFPGPGWYPVQSLGGGMSVANLWINIDEYGNVQGRVVRKDTHVSISGWYDARLWAGDPKSDTERTPLEYWIQRKLQGRSEATNFVRALKCEVDVQNMHYRLYVEYCPHGDLDGIVEEYYHSRQHIPEAFIWMVLSVLVDCGLVMERGGIDDIPQEWREVVHRDLKPANVFLDSKRSDSWPQYPRPKLADFGLAFETSKDDKLNPLIWSMYGAGTRGFLAPEQRAYMDRDTKKPVDAFQLLAHTNVWGIGAILYTLMHRGGTSAREQPTYLPNKRDTYHVRDNLKGVYSHFLRMNVQLCLSFDPANRPSFAELRKRVDNAMNLGTQDGSTSMYARAAQIGIVLNQPENDLVGLPEDKYKLGMVFQRLRQRKDQQDGGSAGSGAGETGITSILMES